MKKCNGCGQELQTIDSSKPGYIPEHVLNEDTCYCQRCFRLKHYGEFSDISESIDFDSIFKHINSNPGLVLYVIDSFNIDGSLIKDFNRKIKGSKVMVIANKIDIWPRSINKNKIVNFIKEKLNEYKISYDHFYCVSALKNKGIDDIYNAIIKTKIKNVYVVGKTNCGKSTFINSLIKSKQLDKSLITTSFYPSTTINTIRVDFEKFILLDTPGLIDNESIYPLLNSKNIKKVINLKEVKPISMSAYNNNYLFIGSLMYLKFNINDKSNLNIYSSNLIKFHKSTSDNILETYKNLTNDNLYVPKYSNEVILGKTVIKNQDSRMMLSIAGLCNIDLINCIGEIEIYKPANLQVVLNKSIFGGKYESNK